MGPTNVAEILILLAILPWSVMCSELTFHLDANDEMCFYEHAKQGEETVLEFQVGID